MASGLADSRTSSGFSRPTDSVFAKAEIVLLEPDFDVCDKRCAALAGVPQQFLPKLCLPMWYLPVIFRTRFRHGNHDVSWLVDSTPFVEGEPSDFKTIRNAGISFMCTDREVCTKW